METDETTPVAGGPRGPGGGQQDAKHVTGAADVKFTNACSGDANSRVSDRCVLACPTRAWAESAGDGRGASVRWTGRNTCLVMHVTKSNMRN